MRKLLVLLLVPLGVLVLTRAPHAAMPRIYQVTGPVVEVTPDTIVVQKGKDKWELGRDASTKVNGGDPKVGAKVTVEYRMTATSIEVKEAGKSAPAKSKK